MIFILNREGTVTETVTSPVYQGSNTNEVVVLAPFAPNNTVTVGFTLPNGLIVQPKLAENDKGTVMTSLPVRDLLLKVGETTETMSAWYCKINRDITRYSGTLTLQFFVCDAAGDILASSSTTIPVQKGVPVLDGATFDASTAAQLQTAMYGAYSSIAAVKAATEQNTKQLNALFDDVSASTEEIATLKEKASETDGEISGIKQDMEELPEQFVQKVSSRGSFRVYGIDPLGESYLFTVEEDAYPNSIVRRRDNGTINTADPVDPPNAVNKQWFDKTIDPLKTQLSNIWTILENTIINVTTVEDAYATRETAGGLPVVDEAPTTVHGISGATTAAANLLPVNTATIVSNGVTFDASGATGAVHITGSITEGATYASATVCYFDLLPGTYTLYAPHKVDKVGWIVRTAAGEKIDEISWNGTSKQVVLTIPAAARYSLYSYVHRSLASELDYTETPMLLRGDVSAALPAFEPYFAGLKHASFGGIVSTGANLVDFSETVPKMYLASGTLYPNDTFRSETAYFPCAAGVTYYYANELSTGYRQFIVVFYDGEKNVIVQYSRASYGQPIAVASPAGAQYMRCSFSKVMNDSGEYTTIPTQPMVYTAETRPAYGPYVGDTSFALTAPVTLGKWDRIDADAGKRIVGTVTETSETPYTEEQLAQYDEYILSADGKTIAYPAATPTEETLTMPTKTYKAWCGGQETITGNPSGLPLTVTQDYYEEVSKA